MLNYYKILEIDNFSDVETVRLAYKDKIRQFHPDVNPDPDATEITKYLNQAKDLLLDEQKKASYDNQLKMAYLYEIRKQQSQPQDRSWSVRNILERRKKMEEQQKLKKKIKYDKIRDYFPLKYRMSLLLMVSLIGLVMFYKNYFVNLTGAEALLAFVGIMLFIISVGMGADQMYKHFWYRSLEKVFNFNYERRIMRLMGISLVLGPLLVITMNITRKNYLLAYEYDFYPAKVNLEESRMDYIVFEYKIDGVWYKKGRFESIQDAYFINKDRIVIRYAKPDPRIAVIVNKDEEGSLPRKL